jgi:hypothetical protein
VALRAFSTNHKVKESAADKSSHQVCYLENIASSLAVNLATAPSYHKYYDITGMKSGGRCWLTKPVRLIKKRLSYVCLLPRLMWSRARLDENANSGQHVGSCFPWWVSWLSVVSCGRVNADAHEGKTFWLIPRARFIFGRTPENGTGILVCVSICYYFLVGGGWHVIRDRTVSRKQSIVELHPLVI